MQRTGYANQSRSHFTGFDIWGTASPQNTSGTGWLGRYLDTLSNPDPLVAWNTQRETPRPLMADRVGVPAITSPADLCVLEPEYRAPRPVSSGPRRRESRRTCRWIARTWRS